MEERKQTGPAGEQESTPADDGPGLPLPGPYSPLTFAYFVEETREEVGKLSNFAAPRGRDPQGAEWLFDAGLTPDRRAALHAAYATAALSAISEEIVLGRLEEGKLPPDVQGVREIAVRVLGRYSLCLGVV
jgi:hypothetical protein